MSVASAKLTSKLQITIPAAIRRRLGIAAGDVVYLAEEEGRVVLRSARGVDREHPRPRRRGVAGRGWRRGGDRDGEELLGMSPEAPRKPPPLFGVDTPNLEVVLVDDGVAEIASDLRATHNLRTPDAIHLASAIHRGADAFVTEDCSHYPGEVRGLPVLTLHRALERLAEE